MSKVKAYYIVNVWMLMAPNMLARDES